MFYAIDDGLGSDPPIFGPVEIPIPLPPMPEPLPLPGISLPAPPPPVISRPQPPSISSVPVPGWATAPSSGQAPVPSQPKTSGGFDLSKWLNLATGIGQAVVGTVAGVQAVKQGLRPAQGYPQGYYQTPTGQVVYVPQEGGGVVATPYGVTTPPDDGVGGVFSLSSTGGVKAAGSTSINPMWLYLGGAVVLIFLLKKK